MTDSLLVGVVFKRVNFRFGLEAPDVQFNFRNIFRSLSLFMIRLVEFFSFYFPFNPRFLWIVELEKHGSGDATITDNKIHFSAVITSGPIRLTGNFNFRCSPFTLINVDFGLGLL